jgi:hypothetical protein
VAKILTKSAGYDGEGARGGEEDGPASADTPSTPEPIVVSEVTPGHIEIEYQVKPKRQYRVRAGIGHYSTQDWRVVPSVTTVLDCLNKPGLPFWGNGVGVDGVLELVNRGLLVWREKW